MTSGAAAGRYARALFDVVVKEPGGNVEKVQADLQAFADLIAGHEALAHTLGNPAIPVQKKVAVVKALLDRSGPIAPPLARLLVLLAERDRLMLLPEIARAYGVRVMDHLKIVRGEVTTAVAVPSETLRALEQGLEKATARKVVLETRVDPSIIGGVVTRVGSTVYDGSVATQLERLKQSLIEAHQ